MSKKTDYKKMWRKQKRRNVGLQNAVNDASRDFKHLIQIPGVMDCVKAFDKLGEKAGTK